MIRRQSDTVMTLIALAAGVAVTGCQTTQPTAREQANERWSVARAEVKAQLAADQFASGNIDAAAGELNEAYRLHPENPDYVPLRARIWLAKGKIAEAEALLTGTTLPGRRQAEIEYLLGVVRQQQQRWSDALDAYLRAAEIDNDAVEYVIAAAQTWLQLGQPQQALEYLGSVSAKFGWTTVYQTTLAECHEMRGDWSAAASAWQRVAYTQGADREVRRRLADALYRSNRYLEAIPTLVELVDAADEPDHQTRMMLAESYLAVGRNNDAQDQARAVLLAERDHTAALRLIARSLSAEGQYRAALRTAQQAMRHDTSDRHSLELVTALAWRVGERELATSTATRLLRVDPQNAIAESVLRRARVPLPSAVD